MKSLRSIIALVLMVNLTIPLGIWDAVFHIPSLVLHFNSHMEKDASKDFADLLTMHYGGDHEHKEEDQEHDRLPFHEHSNLAVALTTVSLPVQRFALGQQGSLDIELPVLLGQRLGRDAGSAVWQPPKVS